jgi:hypothetical protein
VTIDKFSGTFALSCDVCEEEAEETFFDFCDAVKYKKDNGWKSRKDGGCWNDVCPACQEVEE